MELRTSDLQAIERMARDIASSPSIESMVLAVYRELRKLGRASEVRFVFPEASIGWREQTAGSLVSGLRTHKEFPVPSARGTAVYVDPEAPEQGYLWVPGSNARVKAALGVITPHVGTVAMLLSAMRRARTSSQQERELAREALRSRDEERRRISQELHDDLGQCLASLKLNLKWVEDALRAGNRHEEAVEELAGARDAVGVILSKVRDLSHTLYPSLLDTLGLSAAIKELVHQATRRSGIEVSCTTKGEEKPLRKDVSAGLYRCCQEAVNNALRHSQATRISVEIEYSLREVRLTVEDNGKGFIPGNLNGSKAGTITAGFWTIRQRVADLDGAFRVSTAPDSGVTLEVTIPTNVRIFDVRRKDKATDRG